LIYGFGLQETIEASFQTTSGGVILGYQAAAPGSGAYPYGGWVPTLYVGTDGKLYGGSFDYGLVQVRSSAAVNDGQWHTAALVVDPEAQTITLYLDGQLVGSQAGRFSIHMAILSRSEPDTPTIGRHTGGWFGFVGRIDDVRFWSEARSAGEISQDRSAAPSGRSRGCRHTTTSTRARASRRTT